ncbi:MAG: hypothetical protein ACI4O9_02475 [Akkermansia sp.]
MYTFDAASVTNSDTYITINSSSPNTSDYQAYLVYPAINTTITLPILSIE